MKMGNIYLVLYLSSYGNNQNVISPGASSRGREKLIVNEVICLLGHVCIFSKLQESGKYAIKRLFQ